MLTEAWCQFHQHFCQCSFTEKKSQAVRKFWWNLLQFRNSELDFSMLINLTSDSFHKLQFAVRKVRKCTQYTYSGFSTNFIFTTLYSFSNENISYSAWKKERDCNIVKINQRFTHSFYTCRSQKRKKTLMKWLSFCSSGILAHKSCV